MFTDVPPRRHRMDYLKSDDLKTLDLPRNSILPDVAERLESAMKADRLRDVQGACVEFLATASGFYRVPKCGIRVLAARPLRVRERGSLTRSLPSTLTTTTSSSLPV